MSDYKHPMTTREAAEALGTTQAQVRKMIHRGELYAQRSGGWFLIYRPDVEKLAARK